MTTEAMAATPLIQSMAENLQIQLSQENITHYRFVGIRTGGVWVAQLLAETLGHSDSIGELDISFYRDDFTRIGLNPSVRPTNLPFACDNTHIVLVDDILMSGRTVRAAMNEIFDYGRPASIRLAVLADIGGRELPISASVVGEYISLAHNERLKLSGPEDLTLVRQPYKG